MAGVGIERGAGGRAGRCGMVSGIGWWGWGGKYGIGVNGVVMGGWCGFEVCRVRVGRSGVGGWGGMGEWCGGDCTRNINYMIHASTHSCYTNTGN